MAYRRTLSCAVKDNRCHEMINPLKWTSLIGSGQRKKPVVGYMPGLFL